MKAALLLAALALVAGLAVWFGRTDHGAAPLPVAPQPAAPAASSDASPLESDPSTRKPEAQHTTAESNGVQPPAMPQLIDPISVASGADGGMPSDISAAEEANPYAAKYAGASKADLQTAYDGLKVLYDDNAEGRVQERERMLDAEALAELGRELAWLKERAFGGF